jgi:cysteine rich repeat protein
MSMKMRIRRWLALTALPAACLLQGAAPASAQAARQACAGDIAQYCPGIPQGGGKVAQCLRANEQKLSPACRQGMMQMAGMMKEVVQACEDDMHRFCAGAAPGTAKECLRENFRGLSLPCKRELFEAKKAM